MELAYWNIDVPEEQTERTVSCPSNLKLEENQNSINVYDKAKNPSNQQVITILQENTFSETNMAIN